VKKGRVNVYGRRSVRPMIYGCYNDVTTTLYRTDFYLLYMAEYYLEVESDDDVLIRSFKKKIFDDLDKARRYAVQHIPLSSDDVMVHVFEIVNNNDGSIFNHVGDVWATSTYTYDGPCDFLWCPHGSEESDRVHGISQSGKLNRTLYRLT
jgi:hypothetical protein